MKKNITVSSWAPASYPAYPAYASGVGSYYFLFPVETNDTDDRG